MTGKEELLTQFMEGRSRKFVIPVYQRNYDWKEENCKQLYNDLIKISKVRNKRHFFGSIVVVADPEGHMGEYLVIDGQQRITTVSLLFLAMYNLLREGFVTSTDPHLLDCIYEDYLVDKYAPYFENKTKLKPIKKDRAAYNKLFDLSQSEYVAESNLTINYRYFYERIKKGEISVDNLFDAIQQLVIIAINLHARDDDPQLIFESLNSTGLALSEGDKIRNYVLMDLPFEQQNVYYESYWNKIENLTDNNVSMFVRDFLSVKTQMIPPQRRIYTTFKAYKEEKQPDTKLLLDDMLNYAKIYKTLLHGGTALSKLNQCVYRLNKLETTVTRTFFMRVLHLKEDGILNLNQVFDIFQYTENFLFRRTICNLPSNSMNKLFLMLHQEIERIDGTTNDYVEKFKYILSSKKGTLRFPDNHEFREAFVSKAVYQMNKKNKVYLLERLENHGTDEDKDHIYSRYDDGIYSIEHIMPQKLTEEWKMELGDSYEQVHEKWLDRVANLTLTAYNTQYSNYSFSCKKTMENGFNQSGFRMNHWISSKDKWTVAELEERSAYLADQALKIWTYPNTEYKPERRQLEYITLEDDFTVATGKDIAYFRYRNKEIPVSSWVEMYKRVLQFIYVEDKSIITNLARSQDSGLASHFGVSKEQFNNTSVEIGDGIYVSTNTNTQIKLSNLNKLFEKYQIDLSDLLIYLQDEEDV